MFDLEILTPDKELFSGKAEALTATAVDGEIGILSHHAPLITALKKGTLRITLPNGEKKEIPLGQGLLKTENNRVVVLG